MLRSFIYTAFFTLLLTGCYDSCAPSDKYISVFFKNQGDNDIHLFYKINSISNNHIFTFKNEEFDASNKLAPGYIRSEEDLFLPNFYKEGNAVSYEISFYAGRSGVVFKSVTDIFIKASINKFEVIWDGTNLEVSSF